MGSGVQRGDRKILKERYRLKTLLLLIFFSILIIWGIYREEALIVFRNATLLCLSCMGLK
ncbi:MAG: hypothetical protein DDT42_00375 [candidate division WS2 bacterium]|uniref:Thioredoxin n=1 Tax=Psychracetigena formicireducens TaxID=2986056 RepID=A0A9E2BK30_PSYF1|nr:hypothetical protein [Candidatus Psychracetigena formicireducens]MBT9144534.1 hypothetical protein [Candidatus Psychracetigena formicireducens]